MWYVGRFPESVVDILVLPLHTRFIECKFWSLTGSPWLVLVGG